MIDFEPLPKKCVLEGLPKSFFNIGTIASKTSGATEVVAALSR
jgi:hypothetical protein